MALVADRKKLIERVNLEVDNRVSEGEREAVRQFCQRSIEELALEMLKGREPADLYGLLYACWKYLQQFDPSQPKVALFNPSVESHGWSSGKTVIQVLVRDAAFLVGSILSELHSREVTVHTIHNTVLHTLRDDQHRLVKLRSRTESEEGLQREALVYIEINHVSAPELLEELKNALLTVVDEVEVVVADFRPMANKAQEVLAELEGVSNPQNPEAHRESVEFARWLVSNHFTYLGYQALAVTPGESGPGLEAQAGTGLGLVRRDYGLESAVRDDALRQRDASGESVTFGRCRFKSRVHRRDYPESMLFWRFDESGQVSGAHCFMGLWTSSVHTGSVTEIPLVNRKVQYVIDTAGFDADNHNGRELLRILETFPRSELFRTPQDKLYEVATGTFRIRVRSQVRLFMMVDRTFGFVSCLIYVPRNVFHTELRRRLQAILSEAIGATDVSLTTSMSESVMARVHFLFRVEPGRELEVDHEALEQELAEVSRSWEDRLRDSLIKDQGEEEGGTLFLAFESAFPPGYKYDYEPRIAVNDILRVGSLSADRELAMSFTQAAEDDANVLHFRLLRAGCSLILSDVIPILENFGLRVVSERSHYLSPRSGDRYSLQEFNLHSDVVEHVELERVTEHFKEAFSRIWRGDSESDPFNKLLLGAELDWRQVAMLRGYARYMKQLMFPYSVNYIADTLCRHLQITRNIVEYFQLTFSPHLNYDQEQREREAQRCRDNIFASLDQVTSLNEDGVLRHLMTLIDATLRTSYFQLDASGEAKSHIAYKFNTSAIEDAPLPRPEYEIFVYSPRVEGVHLRGGKVARGGLRWSDRYEDFRTEVLGLVKAQQVKNAIIVPVGAKGGFVCKRLPGMSGREEIQREGVACYKVFISGLLDVTDNLVGYDVVPPPNVVRRDGDDPYLVVAADKGTATFSDTANAVAAEYNQWIGDAFASGGQYGYDHKKMGITAKGAWVCTQHHFRELGIDIQKEPFTVVGIGDMGGDVFGNGMLLSECIMLTAAFNHLHIFIDPNPDPAISFAERRRLFDLPRSSWTDYEASLISEGGGVFSRSAKSIPISAQMKERFAIEADSLTPLGLIRALLQAPVDLLWNGGIGTYVRSSAESDSDVGDKANDAVRIDATQLRARVVGEGGNLGMTQLARVEFNLAGGAVNTDFIDNAGGVDCSDYEVNIKILLNDLVAAGDLTFKQRNALLLEMTDDISRLVLGDCDRLSRAISVGESRAHRGMEEFLRFIQVMVSSGRLDRELEFIPDDDTLRDRRHQDKGFTRPELSVLSAYAKAQLKETLAELRLPDEPYVWRFLNDGFPDLICERFGEALQEHRLKKEIIAKNVANEMINFGGITFVHRMRESTGAHDAAIALGFVFAREVFAVADCFKAISEHDFIIHAEMQHELMDRTTGLLRAATRWFLRNRRYELPLGDQIAFFRQCVSDVSNNLSMFLTGSMASYWEDSFVEYQEAGVDQELASAVASGPLIYYTLNIAEAAQKGNLPLLDVAELFFRIGEALGLTSFSRQITEMKVENHWQAIAREGLLDDIGVEQKVITVAVLADADQDGALERWIEARRPLMDRWQEALAELNASPVGEFTMYSVVLRELVNLAHSEALE